MNNLKKEYDLKLYPLSINFTYGNHTTGTITYSTVAPSIREPRVTFFCTIAESIISDIIDLSCAYLPDRDFRLGCTRVELTFTYKKLEDIEVWVEVSSDNGKGRWSVKFDLPRTITDKLIDNIKVDYE